jgi:hypothetical protein
MKNIALLLVLCLALNGCSFYRGHPTRVKVSIAIAGAAAGAGIALASRRGTCPKVYDGHPYNGTPPCPSEADGRLR